MRPALTEPGSTVQLWTINSFSLTIAPVGLHVRTDAFKREVRTRSSAEVRRDEILEAVIRVIADGGPDAVTFRRVAHRANVPLSSLT